jgi:hypothetical protein
MLAGKWMFDATPRPEWSFCRSAMIVPPRRSRWFMPRMLLAAATVAVAFAACGTLSTNTGAPGSEYVVIAPRTAFYKFGPNQNAGPDAMLELGERVTLVSREYGYSRFRTKAGMTGYAFWSDFAPAPPLPQATPTPAPSRRSGGGSGRSRRGPAPAPSADPLFDVRDVPLPELPERDDKPKFRMR